MLAVLGLVTIALLLTVIMTKWMSPLMALILIPIVAALIGGFGWDTSKFIVAGIPRSPRWRACSSSRSSTSASWPTPACSTRSSIGSCDRRHPADPDRPGHGVAGSAGPPRRLRGGDVPGHDPGDAADVRAARDGPAHPRRRRLDGRGRQLPALDGAHDPRLGGPAAIPELFRPLIPVQAIGLAFVFAVAYWLGRREARRLGLRGLDWPRPTRRADGSRTGPATAAALLDQIVLTVVLMGAMVAGTSSSPSWGSWPGSAWRWSSTIPARIQRPGRRARRAALLMASILLAAGAFTGIMRGTGMLGAMAQASVGFLPAGTPNHCRSCSACLDAPEPAVRPGLLLPRGPARAGGGRRAAGVPRSSSARRRCWAR